MSEISINIVHDMESGKYTAYYEDSMVAEISIGENISKAVTRESERDVVIGMLLRMIDELKKLV